MSRGRKHWLREFADRVPASKSFLQAMDKQLAARFHELSGFPMKPRFILMPPLPDPFRIVTHGPVSLLDANLLCSRVAFFVRVAWHNPSSTESVMPTDDVTGNDIEFQWETLPVSAIVAAEKPPTNLLGDAALPFPVSAQPIAGPHVKLVFEMHEPLGDREQRAFESVLRSTQEEWNASPDRTGVIHAMGKLEIAGSRHYAIDIDIGSAGRSGLRSIVDAAAAFVVPITSLHITHY